MSTKTLTVGLIAVAVIAIGAYLSGTRSVSFGSASNCTDGYTCFTNLEIQGNQITDGTSSFVSTTTLSSSLSLTKAAACVNFYATSTATAAKLVFVTTGATSTYNGTVYWAYGSCS